MSTDAPNLVLSTRRLIVPPTTHAPLRRGAVVEVSAWALGYIEQRQRMRGIAVTDAARGLIPLSHITAGAFHGLPLSGVSDERVHTTPLGANPPKTRGDVVRHKRPLRESELTIIDGCVVTTLDRTVFDLLCTLSLEGAVAVMDAALHLVGCNPQTREIDASAVSAFRMLIEQRIRSATGGRGIRIAREAAQLGDPRVESVGESRSRVRMWENRMPAPELQVPVETRLGLMWLDFAWPKLGRFGEFDGVVKTTDPVMLAGRTAGEVRAYQADRREAIKESTGWTGMHWGWPETADAGVYWRTMLAQGWRSRWRA